MEKRFQFSRRAVGPDPLLAAESPVYKAERWEGRGKPLFLSQDFKSILHF
jgi:hypothetical protein